MFQRMCETRWVIKRKSLYRFKELLIDILTALEVLETNQSRSTNEKSHALRNSTNAQFIITFALESRELDLAAACGHVDNIVSILKEMKTNANEEFNIIYADKKCQ